MKPWRLRSILERQVPATEFKARCLALLDEVAKSGVEVVVTKHGRPVAKVVPIAPAPSLRGSVTYLVSDEELIAPLYPNWEPSLYATAVECGAQLVTRDGKIAELDPKRVIW